LKQYIDSDGIDNAFNSTQSFILAHQTVTFALGKYFGCAPHAWDDMPAERVMLDYIFMRVAQQTQAEEMENMKKNLSRKGGFGGNSKGGRPVRTTSDGDYFDRANLNLKD
jgi:hypothetical protein